MGIKKWYINQCNIHLILNSYIFVYDIRLFEFSKQIGKDLKSFYWTLYTDVFDKQRNTKIQ